MPHTVSLGSLMMMVVSDDGEIHIPRKAVVAVSFIAALIGIGATAGIQVVMLRAQITHADSNITAHVRHEAEESVRFASALDRLELTGEKVDALIRLKCIEALGLLSSAARHLAIDHLALAAVDCTNTTGNRVPGQ